MRKVGLITLAVIGSAMFMSCSSSKTADYGYFGISNKKNTKKQVNALIKLNELQHRLKLCYI